MKSPIIAPSLLAADYANFAAGLSQINTSGAEWVHLDIMDGSFVPPISFGAGLVSALRPQSKLVFDAHLMTNHPETFIEDFAEAGADCITFHAEAAIHSHRIVQQIHKLGKKAGIAIVPSTPVCYIEEMLPFVDLVLVMTVNPGWGGQALIPQCLDKVKTLAALRSAKQGAFLISIDGGVNPSTAGAALAAGPDVMVAGSAFFKAPDKAALVKRLKAGGAPL